MLEPCDAKVSSTVLRGLGDRKVAWLLGSLLPSNAEPAQDSYKPVSDNVTNECCPEHYVRLS